MPPSSPVLIHQDTTDTPRSVQGFEHLETLQGHTNPELFEHYAATSAAATSDHSNDEMPIIDSEEEINFAAYFKEVPDEVPVRKPRERRQHGPATRVGGAGLRERSKSGTAALTTAVIASSSPSQQRKSSGGPTSAKVTKRGRGRPPRDSASMGVTKQQTEETEVIAETPTARRGPGRPRKNPDAPNVQTGESKAKDEEMKPDVKTTIVRRRGRPTKVTRGVLKTEITTNVVAANTGLESPCFDSFTISALVAGTQKRLRLRVKINKEVMINRDRICFEYEEV